MTKKKVAHPVMMEFEITDEMLCEMIADYLKKKDPNCVYSEFYHPMKIDIQEVHTVQEVLRRDGNDSGEYTIAAMQGTPSPPHYEGGQEFSPGDDWTRRSVLRSIKFKFQLMGANITAIYN